MSAIHYELLGEDEAGRPKRSWKHVTAQYVTWLLHFTLLALSLRLYLGMRNMNTNEVPSYRDDAGYQRLYCVLHQNSGGTTLTFFSTNLGSCSIPEEDFLRQFSGLFSFHGSAKRRTRPGLGSNHRRYLTVTYCCSTNINGLQGTSYSLTRPVSQLLVYQLTMQRMSTVSILPSQNTTIRCIV
jgi:hypothetical protein